VPVSPEVNSFQREIGRNKKFLSGRESQDGAVISDSGRDRSPGKARALADAAGCGPLLGMSCELTNLLNQRFFG
jgi:hypothetical protein